MSVLIIEDEPIVIAVVQRVLLRCGFTTLIAQNASAAIGYYRDGRTTLDLIIVERDVPGMSGIELARRLIECRPDVSVLFMSGTPLEFWGEDDLRGLAELAKRCRPSFLEKPFTAKNLIQAIEQALSPRTLAMASRC
jgi:CheY-like chemotaxis protein